MGYESWFSLEENVFESGWDPIAQSSGAENEKLEASERLSACIHIPMIFKNGFQEWSFAGLRMG
jgi:hypothetical protein